MNHIADVGWAKVRGAINSRQSYTWSLVRPAGSVEAEYKSQLLPRVFNAYSKVVTVNDGAYDANRWDNKTVQRRVLSHSAWRSFIKDIKLGSQAAKYDLLYLGLTKKAASSSIQVDMDYSLFCRALHKLADLAYPKLGHKDAIKTLGNLRVFHFAKIEPLPTGYADAAKTPDKASKSPRLLSMMQQTRRQSFTTTYEKELEDLLTSGMLDDFKGVEEHAAEYEKYLAQRKAVADAATAGRSSLALSPPDEVALDVEPEEEKSDFDLLLEQLEPGKEMEAKGDAEYEQEEMEKARWTSRDEFNMRLSKAFRSCFQRMLGKLHALLDVKIPVGKQPKWKNVVTNLKEDEVERHLLLVLNQPKMDHAVENLNHGVHQVRETIRKSIAVFKTRETEKEIHRLQDWQECVDTMITSLKEKPIADDEGEDDSLKKVEMTSANLFAIFDLVGEIVTFASIALGSADGLKVWVGDCSAEAGEASKACSVVLGIFSVFWLKLENLVNTQTTLTLGQADNPSNGTAVDGGGADINNGEFEGSQSMGLVKVEVNVELKFYGLTLALWLFLACVAISFIYPVYSLRGLREAKEGKLGVAKDGKPAEIFNAPIAFMYVSILKGLGSSLYVPLVNTLNTAILCNDDDRAILLLGTENSCYSGPHFGLMVLMVCSVFMYYPVATFMYPNLQFVDKSVDLKFDTTFIVLLFQLKLLMTLIQTVFSQDLDLLLIASGAVVGTLCFLNHTMDPCILQVVNIWRTASYLMCLLFYVATAVGMLAGNDTGGGLPILPLIVFGGGSVVVLVYTYKRHRKIRAQLETKQNVRSLKIAPLNPGTLVLPREKPGNAATAEPADTVVRNSIVRPLSPKAKIT